jgi:hypothetical protein
MGQSKAHKPAIVSCAGDCSCACSANVHRDLKGAALRYCLGKANRQLVPAASNDVASDLPLIVTNNMAAKHCQHSMLSQSNILWTPSFRPC